jgi:hypothetical protein
MKYGIIVNQRVTEPVSIPDPLPAWAEDVDAFLATMFPGYSGWVEVPDYAVPGTPTNPDGSFPPIEEEKEEALPEGT